MSEIIQGSPEWFAQRLGKVTASRIADVMAKTKSGYGAGRRAYMAEIMLERLTGTHQDSFTNAAMQWGTDTEPMARSAYIEETYNTVVEVPMIDHPTIKMAGASPDGLVNDDGLVEIKCPNTSTHLDTLVKQTINARYVKQMQWQMACTQREWCDFVSFDPRLPEHLQLFTERVERDDDLIKEISAEVEKFNSEVDSSLEKLNQLYPV